ncbi:MAG: HD domain-containing protein [Ruminiclostridium sp.]|nr:HD domain-containing protein [Ruminiclostridium sp.]
MSKAYSEYIDRMAEIRRLSSPTLEEIDGADAYSTRLRQNFLKISELAALNREFLDKEFYPCIGSDEPLDDERINELTSFGELLISAECAESIDLPIMSLLSDRLVTDAEERSDIDSMIIQLDAQTGTFYELMNMTLRIRSYPAIADRYRELGFSVGLVFYEFLQKDRFAKIDDERVREIIITNARYSIAFYEGICSDAKKNREQLEKLEYMLEIENDPFYRELVPHYDWLYHRFRVLQYYALASEKNNAAGFTKEQLLTIYERSRELVELWDNNLDYFEKRLNGKEIREGQYVLMLLNELLCGKTDAASLQRELIHIYNNRDAEDYTTRGCCLNLMIPLEMILLANGYDCVEEYEYILGGIYRDLLAYAFRSPNAGSFTAFLEYYVGVMESFIETPDCISFEEMGLEIIAAFHPPTYVHSMLVGQITEYLCRCLLKKKPELFIGMRGCKNIDDVAAQAGAITEIAYHSALCHDFGKITIIDTVIVYGRKLLDMEFDLIKTHPRTGSDMLKRHPSTQAYADIALGHHRWYDNSRGYPEEFDTSKSEYKTIIDIVQCADCLDAATDTVGRSYSRSKSLRDFIGELNEGSGTRYAPWLSELFADPEICRDIEYMITSGRQQNYRNTYYLLRKMHEKTV